MIKILFIFFLLNCAGYQKQELKLDWKQDYGVNKVKIEPTRVLGHFPYIAAESSKNLKFLMDKYKGIEVVNSGEDASLQLVIQTEDKVAQSTETSSRVRAEIDSLNGSTRPDIFIPATSLIKARFQFFLVSPDKKTVYLNRSFSLSERLIRQNLLSDESVVNETQNRGLLRKAMERLSKRAFGLFKQVVLDEF